MSILRDEELIRPSKWQEQPPPNRECTNWNGCLRWDFTAGAAFNLMTRQSKRQRNSREYTLIAPYALVELQESGKIIVPFPVAECTLT